MTTITFAQFISEHDAKKTIQLNVLKWSYMLCESLVKDYHECAIRGHQHFIDQGESVEHHQKQIEKLKQGISPINYVIQSGSKYHKIIMTDGGNSRSTHAFVDKKTGEIYKAESWNRPAKGVRYDLRLIKDREWLFENADYSGGYLYKRFMG